MLKKFLHIVKGWGRYCGIISTSTAQKKLSELRLSICNVCPDAEADMVVEIEDDDFEMVNSLKCSICKCPCQQKSLVTDEKCPLGKW